MAAAIKLLTDNHEPKTDSNPLLRRAVGIYSSLHRAGVPIIGTSADSIDLALSVGMLSEVEDVDRVFRQVHRVLKPGGSFHHCDMLRPGNPLVERMYYGFLRLINLQFDLLTSFSLLPLQMLTLLGVLIAWRFRHPSGHRPSGHRTQPPLADEPLAAAPRHGVGTPAPAGEHEQAGLLAAPDQLRAQPFAPGVKVDPVAFREKPQRGRRVGAAERRAPARPPGTDGGRDRAAAAPVATAATTPGSPSARCRRS